MPSSTGSFTTPIASSSAATVCASKKRRKSSPLDPTQPVMERSHQPSGRSATPADINRNARPTSSEPAAKAGIGSWLGFYNEERQHQSLGYRTPRQAYEAECPWRCGRSASPTGCAFAHIPTGATANHRIDIDEEERSSAMTVAPGAIGAGTEIGRATP